MIKEGDIVRFSKGFLQIWKGSMSQRHLAAKYREMVGRVVKVIRPTQVSYFRGKPTVYYSCVELDICDIPRRYSPERRPMTVASSWLRLVYRPRRADESAGNQYRSQCGGPDADTCP